MATYVLVHGGGHGGWCYQRVARLLRSSGHEVYTPTLSGLGERSNLLSPDIDLDLHVRDVVAVLHYEDLDDVILVGHSYGGMVITGAADRAADRIGRVVYLDAANPQNGQSLVDVAGPIIESTRPLGAVVDGVELVLLPSPEAGLFYGVTDPDDVAWMADRLTGHPWKCFEQPLRLTERGRLRRAPAVPHRLHVDAGHPRSRAHGEGTRRRAPMGDRHRSRPHDHGARGGHRGVAADRGRVMSPHPAPPAGIDPLDLVDPERFAHRGYPHEVWTHLRAEAPVAFFEPPGYQPFWAITKHADITDITAQPVRFSNEHGLILGRIGARRAAHGDGRHARSAAPRPTPAGRDAPPHAPRDPVATGRDRPHRGRGARRGGGDRRHRGIRLRRARRRAAPDRGDRLAPRRAAIPTGSCCSGGPTR